MIDSLMRGFFIACAEAALAGSPADGVLPSNHNLIREGAENFAVAIEAAPSRGVTAKTLPITDQLTAPTTEIGRQFQDLASQMVWYPGRGDAEGKRRGLVDINAMFELGDVRAGLLFIAPHDGYPEHEHPPQEFYIMLDGTGAWRFGGSTDYFDVPPGKTIYNNPRDTHGVRAGDEATLSMWVLWGDNTFHE